MTLHFFLRLHIKHIQIWNYHKHTFYNLKEQYYFRTQLGCLHFEEKKIIIDLLMYNIHYIEFIYI